LHSSGAPIAFASASRHRLAAGGKGVPRDYAEPMRLFEQGAALGEPSAMNGIGAMYNDGNGVRRDARVARQRFEKAAALGDPQAKQNLKEMRR
jgi:TPR repeat protein